MTASVQVDVIVAVYDALPHVRSCLSSLEQHADGFDVRVIVVDDGSSSETKSWLRARAQTWPSLCLLEHEHNCGYTRAANHGLHFSSAPWVVVLNSDTVVSAGWLTGMIRCAAADPDIGMVGPLSNAASWQSVPEVAAVDGTFIVNRLALGLDVDGMAELVRSCSIRRYPKLPVLNGFCLLLRRELIERIGRLDEETFPIGYGEENDYCLRATQAGFRLAVADDVYVFHAKSQSFGEARRREYSRRAGRALIEKHGRPRVEALSREARANPELHAVREAIGAALSARQEIVPVTQASALGVVFLLPAAGASGGASSVIMEAAELVALGARVRVVVPANALGQLASIYGHVPNVRQLLCSPPLDQLLDFSKDFDVVVATAYYTMEWVARIVASNPTIAPAYYVQDYEPWFHAEGSRAALAAAASYTRVPEALLFAKTGFLQRLLAARHAVRVEKVPPGLDHRVFYPVERRLADVVRVTAMVRPQTPRRSAPRTMRVLRELSLRHPKHTEVHIFGCESSDQRFRELAQDFRFVNHGVLRPSQVADVLRQTDIFVDLSDYQAFGRTAAEAMASGAVPVVPRAGGSDEFARDGLNSLTLDTADEASCVERISGLILAPHRLEPMRRAALAATAAFTHAAAASKQLELMTAARAQRAPRPFSERRPRLALVRPGGAPRMRLALGAPLGSWKAPCVQKKWRIAEITTLPEPGFADVAIVALPLQRANWPAFARWLGRWRRAGGRLVAQLELPNDGAGGEWLLSSELRWLSEAADALAVPIERDQRRLASAGLEACLVRPALDPILWRLGPAERGPALRPISHQQRIGLFGSALGPELSETVRCLKEVFADRLVVEVVGGGLRARQVGKPLKVPRFDDEVRLVQWAFDTLSWDLALIPEAEPGLDHVLQQLEVVALGAACIHVGSDIGRASKAACDLLDDAAAAGHMAEDARTLLTDTQSALDWGIPALELVDRVQAAPSRSQASRPLASVRHLASGFRPGWRESRGVEQQPEPAFPEPLSKMQRKLAKLRRDPRAFFRDSRWSRLRLPRGRFE